MGIVQSFRNAVTNRPLAIILPLVFSILLGLINYFNPAFTLLINLVMMGNNNVFAGFIAIMQLILNPSVLIKGSIYLAVGLVLLSLFISFLLAGYFGVVNNSVKGKDGYNGEFAQNAKRNYARILRITITVIFLGIILLLFYLVALMPALAVTRAVIGGKTVLAASAVFLDVITLLTFLTVGLFFKIYVVFWYPAAFNVKNRPFTAGKHAADSQFWSVAGKVLSLDMIYFVIEALLVLAAVQFTGTDTGSRVLSILVCILNAGLLALYFAAFSAYVFTAYNTYSENGRTE